MSYVHRPQAGNTSGGPNQYGTGGSGMKKKKSPVRKVGKGGKRGY